MKKILITLAISGISAQAIAEQGDVYIDVAGGVNLTTNAPTWSITNSAIPSRIRAYNISNWFNNDKGNTFHLGAGYALTDNLRVGARYSYHSADTQVATTTPGTPFLLTTDRHSHALMAEVAYDFINSSNFTPYVKAGLGVARNSYRGVFGPFVGGGGPVATMPKNTETDFAWRLGAGVNYRFNENLSVMAEYQYSDLGSVRTANGAQPGGGDVFHTAGDYRVSEINVGFRFDF